jgi:hypothetical protein
MLERFVEVVNSQIKYNTDGINAVPILIWHKIDNSNEEYSTSTNLFNAEMKYLHDNNFTVLTMADLVYDDTSKYLKVTDSNVGADRPIPKHQSEYAVGITNLEENESLPTEKADLISEVANGEDIASEKNRPVTTRDDTLYDEISRPQSDGNNQIEEGAESRIPSAILQYILEH